ncbi:MAG: hypothetical protein HY078_08470 [Elusimicrobia bacterium]|nr:hypothetical protein [Elusimicrobiota bacterium]
METKLEKPAPEAPSRWPYVLTGLVIGSALGAFATSETGKKVGEKAADWARELGDRMRRERLARAAREHRPIEKVLAGEYK